MKITELVDFIKSNFSKEQNDNMSNPDPIPDPPPDPAPEPVHRPEPEPRSYDALKEKCLFNFSRI